MAKGVVYGLQIVDITEQQQESLAIALGQFELLGRRGKKSRGG